MEKLIVIITGTDVIDTRVQIINWLIKIAIILEIVIWSKGIYI